MENDVPSLLLSILLSYIGSIFAISLAEQYRQHTITQKELSQLHQVNKAGGDDIESGQHDIAVSKPRASHRYFGWLMLVRNSYTCIPKLF
jgi:hypothetical protein